MLDLKQQMFSRKEANPLKFSVWARRIRVLIQIRKYRFYRLFRATIRLHRSPFENFRELRTEGVRAPCPENALKYNSPKIDEELEKSPFCKFKRALPGWPVESSLRSCVSLNFFQMNSAHCTLKSCPSFSIFTDATSTSRSRWFWMTLNFTQCVKWR